MAALSNDLWDYIFIYSCFLYWGPRKRSPEEGSPLKVKPPADEDLPPISPNATRSRLPRAP